MRYSRICIDVTRSSCDTASVLFTLPSLLRCRSQAGEDRRIMESLKRVRAEKLHNQEAGEKEEKLARRAAASDKLEEVAVIVGESHVVRRHPLDYFDMPVVVRLPVSVKPDSALRYAGQCSSAVVWSRVTCGVRSSRSGYRRCRCVCNWNAYGHCFFGFLRGHHCMVAGDDVDVDCPRCLCILCPPCITCNVVHPGHSVGRVCMASNEEKLLRRRAGGFLREHARAREVKESLVTLRITRRPAVATLV